MQKDLGVAFSLRIIAQGRDPTASQNLIEHDVHSASARHVKTGHPAFQEVGKTGLDNGVAQRRPDPGRIGLLPRQDTDIGLVSS